MKRKPKTYIPLAITVFPETMEQMDALIAADLYKNRSEMIREGIKHLHERIQIEALINDFVQMDDPNQYKQFFLKIKEIINHV